MSISLAIKYRPRKFEDVVAQGHVKKILSNQLKTKEIQQAYLFCGGSGTGKTTTARIFAKEVNEGVGLPIEINAASNNGVDDIRQVIDDCKMRPLEGDYKIYIIDECHMLSIGAFNALLKVLEEPPKHVIFILCTTDPQKIPATVLGRLQRFNFSRISTDLSVARLVEIIDMENEDARSDESAELIQYEDEALTFISKLADGGMRDAITKLDTVLGYTKYIDVDAVINCLGATDYDLLSELLYAVYDMKAKECIDMIETIHMEGKDLKLFMRDFTNYILEINKIIITKDVNSSVLPTKYAKTAEEFATSPEFMVGLLGDMNKLTNAIKWEQHPKPLIESELIILCQE